MKSGDSMRVCMILRADLYRPWPILRAAREVDLLKSQGKDVTVVSWIKDENSALPQFDVVQGVETKRVFLVPPKSTLLRFPAFLKSNRLLAGEAIDARPDALIVHDLEVLRAGVLAERRLGVPLVYHAHEDWPAMVSERSKLESRVFSFLEKRYCRKVESVLVPSEGIGKKYREWGLKVTVQYASKSMADLPDITPDKRTKLRSRLGFFGSDLVVGLAGSLGRAEAFNNILAAMKELPPSVKLLVVGGLEDRIKAAEKLAKSEGLRERVRFTGFLESTPYMEHVGALDVGLALFIGRTLNVVHVVPIKLFDYMAMGVPVIASDLPAMRTIVEEYGCGIIANSENPRSITSAVKILLEHPDKRAQASRMARLAFESKFSWERQQNALKESSPVFR